MTVGETFFWTGQTLEVVGILWTMLGLKPEWRMAGSRAAEFVTRTVARFKKPAVQGVIGVTLESAIMSSSGVIAQLDVWPSNADQQIAELKSRIEAERAQVEKRFTEVTKTIGESEERMVRKVDDIEEKLAGLADDLDQFKISNWVPKLGGPLTAGVGVVLTAIGNLIV